VDLPSSPARTLDPASTNGGTTAARAWIQRQWWGRVDGFAGPMDGLSGLIHGVFLFFCYFCLIYRGGQQTASEKAILTVTFYPRRLQKPPGLRDFARLGKQIL